MDSMPQKEHGLEKRVLVDNIRQYTTLHTYLILNNVLESFNFRLNPIYSDDWHYNLNLAYSYSRMIYPDSSVMDDTKLHESLYKKK